MTVRVLRTVTVTVLAGLALLLGAAPAFAHTRLMSSDPADGSSIDTAPQRVSVTFNETMTTDFSTLTVLGPDGGRYETGPVAANGGTVSIGLLPLGPAGRYEIGYRVVSEDGHPVSGSIAFTLSEPGPGAGTPAPTAAPTTAPAPLVDAPTPAAAAGDGQGGGTPIWPWIVGAVVLVGGGVVAALRLGR